MKKTVMALSLGMVIGSTATAAAAANDTIQAVMAKFIVKLNGEEKQLNNPMLVVDGTSYLPLREAATLFGYQVGYDTSTRTIAFDLKGGDALYETITPDMSEWIDVLDIISYLKANDMKASIEGDASQTHITLGVYGFGFPISMDEQYRDTETAKLVRKQRDSKLSLLVYNQNMYVRKADIKSLGFPIPEEWLPLTDLENPAVKLDLMALDGVKKLTPVYLTTEKGVVRAMNSRNGIMLNKEDLHAREIIK